MTRENKAGLAIAGVFLTLVGTVGVMKWRDTPGQHGLTMSVPAVELEPEPPAKPRVVSAVPDKKAAPLAKGEKPKEPTPNPGRMPVVDVVKDMGVATIPATPLASAAPSSNPGLTGGYLAPINPGAGNDDPILIPQGPPAPPRSGELQPVQFDLPSSAPPLPGVSPPPPVPSPAPGSMTPPPGTIPGVSDLVPPVPVPQSAASAAPLPNTMPPAPVTPLPETPPVPVTQPPIPVPSPISVTPEPYTPPPPPEGLPSIGSASFTGPMPKVTLSPTEIGTAPPPPPVEVKIEQRAPMNPIPVAPLPAVPVSKEKTTSGAPLEGSQFDRAPGVSVATPRVGGTSPPLSPGGAMDKSNVELTRGTDTQPKPVTPTTSSGPPGLEPVEAIPTISVPTDPQPRSPGLPLSPVPGTRSTLPSGNSRSIAQTAEVRIGGGVASAVPVSRRQAPYNITVHPCLQEDKWETISQRYLNSTRWADALRAYNMGYRGQNPRIQREGIFQAGDEVIIPPTHILLDNFPRLIRPE